MEKKDQNTKMEEIYPFKEAEQYVNLLQENITRMANNSANCKNWLIGIIGGAIAVVFAKDSEQYLPNVLLMLKWATILFFFLDCFYLGIERNMIKAERAFIDACKNNTDYAKKLFMSYSKEGKEYDPKEKECKGKLRNIWGQLKSTLCAIVSLSTLPFYSVIYIMLCVVGNFGTNCCCCCCH